MKPHSVILNNLRLSSQRSLSCRMETPMINLAPVLTNEPVDKCEVGTIKESFSQMSLLTSNTHVLPYNIHQVARRSIARFTPETLN